jgi:hypothetical protein
MLPIFLPFPPCHRIQPPTIGFDIMVAVKVQGMHAKVCMPSVIPKC